MRVRPPVNVDPQVGQSLVTGLLRFVGRQAVHLSIGWPRCPGGWKNCSPHLVHAILATSNP